MLEDWRRSGGKRVPRLPSRFEPNSKKRARLYRNRDESLHAFLPVVSALRERDGHKAKGALTCLCAFRTRALIERQPERCPESEDGSRRHE